MTTHICQWPLYEYEYKGKVWREDQGWKVGFARSGECNTVHVENRPEETL